MELQEKKKSLPASPGVYLMKDSLGDIIYVGKSKNLKHRVSSYFQNTKSRSPKIEKLVKNLKDFEYILTDTEFEAFMLECKLIKEIKPRYNSLMKSPISYAYIKIKIHDKYPNLEVSTQCSKSDGNLYFGPYPNPHSVERAVQGIKECCKILCSNNQRKSTSCLNYSLGLCIGTCLDLPSMEEYSALFNKILSLLKGADKSILQEMELKMNSAAENFDFETAAKYRDYISAINTILNKTKLMKFTKENKNIAILEYLKDDTVKFFLIKGNNILFSEKYDLKHLSFADLKLIFKHTILLYFKNSYSKNSIDIKKEEIYEAQIVYSYLKSKSNNCSHIIIAKKWLAEVNSTSIDTSISKLVYNLRISDILL